MKFKKYNTMIEFLQQIEFTLPEQNFNLAILAMLVALMVIFERHQKRGSHRNHSGETN